MMTIPSELTTYGPHCYLKDFYQKEKCPHEVRVTIGKYIVEKVPVLLAREYTKLDLYENGENLTFALEICQRIDAKVVVKHIDNFRLSEEQLMEVAQTTLQRMLYDFDDIPIFPLHEEMNRYLLVRMVIPLGPQRTYKWVERYQISTLEFIMAAAKESFDSDWCSAYSVLRNLDKWRWLQTHDLQLEFAKYTSKRHLDAFQCCIEKFHLLSDAEKEGFGHT